MARRYLLPLLTALTCLGCAKAEPEPTPAPLDYSHAADFSFTGTLQNATPITFSSASPDAKSYSWNFGDGTALSTEQQPAHTFRKAGTYPVQLTVQSPGGAVKQTQSLTLAQADTLTPIFAAVVGEYRFTKVHYYGYASYAGSTVSACDVGATVSRIGNNLQVERSNQTTGAGDGMYLAINPPTAKYKYYGFLNYQQSWGEDATFRVGTDSIVYHSFVQQRVGSYHTTYYGRRR